MFKILPLEISALPRKRVWRIFRYRIKFKQTSNSTLTISKKIFEYTSTEHFFVRNDFVRNDFVRNDFVRNDFARNDFVRNDFVRNDFVQNDFVRNDFVRNDFVRNDFVRKVENNSQRILFKTSKILTLRSVVFMVSLVAAT